MNAGADGDGPRVLHADAWIAVVEKPPGVPSVPARDPREPSSLIDRVRLAIDGFVEAVHRLDRDTSGLIVFARSVESRRRLGMAFERGKVDKRYVAVVEGGPPSSQGTLHLPIAKAPDGGPRYRVDPILGVRAVTRWRLLQTTQGEDGGRSLLELEPITGRSHQLRVHLAWLGSPIVGDPLYGRHVDSAEGIGRERMLLHATRLDFPHPEDGRRMRFESPASFTMERRIVIPGSA